MNSDLEKSAGGSGPNLLWPGMIAVFLSLYGYFKIQPPLDSVRPEVGSHYIVPAPPSPPGFSAQQARLWEDPLEAAYRGEQLGAAEGSGAGSAPRNWFEHLVPWLESAGTDSEIQDHFRTIVGNLTTRMLVMPVLVPGGPYSDERETRMRIRYAVLSALGVHHYKLSFPDRLSYIKLPVQIHNHLVDENWQTKLVVPVKIYSVDEAKEFEGHEHDDQGDGDGLFEKVLVVWINESQLGSRPLGVVAQIVEGMFGKLDDSERKKLRMRMIGPSSSDLLLAMQRESVQWEKWSAEYSTVFNTAEGFQKRYTNYFNRFHSKLYSPRATLDIQALRPEKIQSVFATTDRGGFDLQGCGLKLIRGIGTDRQLAEALGEELELRDALPGPKNPKANIVLLTERDSLYGRAVPTAFRQFLKEEWNKEDAKHHHHEHEGTHGHGHEPEHHEAKAKKRLHVFRYLRGIDGKTGVSRQEDASSRNAQRPARGREDPETSARDLPQGAAQFDYLRRLADRLSELEEELRRDGNRRITAIGVIGTDVYDKLLVLRALRKEFSHVWFFTTDLDAIFSHDRELEYTQNLLVSSHFGLRLHADLQHGVPPFRDSYQTSTFFATLLSLDMPEFQGLDNRADFMKNPWGVQTTNQQSEIYLKPLIFEIGRDRAYQLTRPGRAVEHPDHEKAGGPSGHLPRSASEVIHPGSKLEHAWITSGGRVWWSIIGLIGLLICISAVSDSFRQGIVRIKRILAEAGGAMVAMVRGKSGQRTPMARDNRAVVVCFIATLLLIGVMIWDDGRSDGEPFLLFSGISLWPSTVIRYLAALATVYFIWKSWKRVEEVGEKVNNEFFGLKKNLFESKTSVKEVLKRHKLDNWLSWKTDSFKDASNAFAELLWGDVKSVQNRPSIKSLFGRYLYEGRTRFRMRRTTLLSLAWFAFGISLFMINGLPMNPYRGWVSEVGSFLVLLAAVLASVFLVFLVLDATSLCHHFVRDLGNSRHDRSWAALGGMARSLGVKPEDARERMIIRVIAEVTEVTGRLVFYPFLVLLLMLISRSRLIDNFGYPWPLVVIQTTILAALGISSLLLHYRAVEAREKVLERLRHSLRRATGPRESARAKRLGLLMQEIQRERKGAFSPLAQHPLLKALAFPTGGASILLLIEHVLR